MTEQTEKVQKVVEVVTMTDGRVVEFSGKRKLLKEILITETSAQVRFDVRNGETRTFTVPSALLLKLAAHGASQKIGDETAGETELDDIVIAIDSVIERLNQGDFNVMREAGDSYAGASVVIRAIAEVSGRPIEVVKQYLQTKIANAKASGQKLTRTALYASFRVPGTKTAEVIARLEANKKPKEKLVIDADALLTELS